MPAAPERPLQHRGRGETIFVVEDNPDVKTIAGRCSNSSVTASSQSTRRALDFIEQGGEADLVFSDVMLPGEMNGVELAKNLHAQKPALPVLLTSGYAEALTRNQGIPILRKPYRMAALADAMHATLRIGLCSSRHQACNSGVCVRTHHETAKGNPVSTRVGTMRRMAAVAAVFALALNLAIGALASAAEAPFDISGRPICSEHTADSDNPSSPANTAQCQFCCVLSVADSVAAPVLPLPRDIEWRSPPRTLTDAPLPRPSRHLAGPPRGPPA